jgi:hypothetical protein
MAGAPAGHSENVLALGDLFFITGLGVGEALQHHDRPDKTDRDDGRCAK